MKAREVTERLLRVFDYDRFSEHLFCEFFADSMPRLHQKSGGAARDSVLNIVVAITPIDERHKK